MRNTGIIRISDDHLYEMAHTEQNVVAYLCRDEKEYLLFLKKFLRKYCMNNEEEQSHDDLFGVFFFLCIPSILVSTMSKERE